MSRLRRSLIPGLFALIGKNITYKDDFSVFEIGSVYIPRDSSNNLPDERQMAAGLVIKKVGESSVFSLMKGKIEMLFERFHLKEAQLVNFNSIGQFTQCIDLANLGELSQFHPGRRALLSNGTTAFGMIAELNPKLLKDAGIDFNDYRVAVFSMDVQLLMENVIKEERRLKYNRLPRYPQVVLALAIVVDESVTVHEVYQFILSHKLPGTCSDPSIIESIELFDIYRGKPLSRGKKSLAFDVYYRKSDRTLTEKEANRVHEEIAQKIREHGWELR